MRHNMLLAATCAALLTMPTLQVEASTSPSEFDIVMVAISPTTWQAIKYHTGTGEAWIAGMGNWRPIEDTAKIPEGKYVIKMTALSSDWAAIRYEVNTGQSWQCLAGVWVEMPLANAEPIDQPATPESSVERRSSP